MPSFFERSGMREKITALFLKVGKIEGYSYLALLGVAMPLKYLFGQPEWVRVVGMAHGVLFLAFSALLAVLFFRYKWPFKNAVVSFLLSFVPFGTFKLPAFVPPSRPHLTS